LYDFVVLRIYYKHFEQIRIYISAFMSQSIFFLMYCVIFYSKLSPDGQRHGRHLNNIKLYAHFVPSLLNTIEYRFNNCSSVPHIYTYFFVWLKRRSLWRIGGTSNPSVDYTQHTKSVECAMCVYRYIYYWVPYNNII